MNKKTIVVIASFVILIFGIVYFGSGDSKLALFSGSQRAAAPCSITNFSANPTSVFIGGSSTLTWGTSGNGCISASISPTIGPVTPVSSGSIPSGALFTTTTFTLTVNGTLTRQATVTVNPCLSLSVISSNPSSGGLVHYYEDSFQGGVTVAGYSPTSSSNLSSTGTFNINIPSGSISVRKAYFIAGRHGCAPPLTVTLSSSAGSNNYTFNNANQASNTFNSSQYDGYSNVHIIDVTANINLNVNNYTLTVPVQFNSVNRYNDFALYVAYNNSAMSVTNANIFLNTQNFSPSPPAYIFNFTNPILTSYPSVALSLMTGYICDDSVDSEKVKINTTFLTNSTLPYLGNNDINSGICGGPLGSFSYSNGVLIALSDDNANQVMQSSDALSNIRSILTSTVSSLTMNLNATSINNTTNAFWAAFVTYGNPAPPPTPASCITNMTETATSTSATLNWTNNPPLPNTGNISVRYKPASSSVWTNAVNVGTNGNTATINSLSPNTQYLWQVVPESCPSGPSTIRGFSTTN